MKPDLSQLSARELLQLDSELVNELRHRGLVRTNNKPLGDFAESIVRAARGGLLEPSSTKSHDVIDPQGRKIQVKAMGVRSPGRSGQFSVFRSFDFDIAIFLVFEVATFDLVLAKEVPANVIQEVVPYRAHVNGRSPTLRQVEKIGIDVLAEMRSVYEKLDGDISGVVR